MEYLKMAALIIGPYIIYSLIIKWLENEHDIELSKFLKTLVFITIDLIIIMIFN